jgi:hypothetical protein
MMLLLIETKLNSADLVFFSAVPKLVPSDPEFIPSHQELSPCDRKFVPSLPEFFPSHSESVPSPQEFVPSHPEFAPSYPEFVPSHRKFVPSGKEFVPSDKEFVSGNHNLSKEFFNMSLIEIITGTAYRNTGQYSPARGILDVFSTVHESKHKFHLRNYATDHYKSIPLK